MIDGVNVETQFSREIKQRKIRSRNLTLMLNARNTRWISSVTTWIIFIRVYSCVSTVEQLYCCRSYFLMDFLSCLLMIDCKLCPPFLFFFTFSFSLNRYREKRRVETWPESATKRECSFFTLFFLSSVPAHFFSLSLSLLR